tara:strand:- start:16 stop:837 length:822 start_codon:yes stop_codon:yes gene_type:complete
MGGTKYRNFGGSGKEFSRRPPMPRSDCNFKGKKITSKKELDKYLSGNAIQCLICGEYFSSVSSHVFNKHGVTVKDYKDEFGIPQKTGIIIKSLKKLLSDNWSVVVGMDKRKQDVDSGDIKSDVDLYLRDRLTGFISFVNECTGNEISIYKADANHTNKVHSHAKKYKDQLLIDAIKENQKYTYNEKPSVVSWCANKGCDNKVHRFGSQSSLYVDSCCSYECSAEFKKSKRIEKPCKDCGRIMLLTKGNYNRISRCCGRRSNSKAKGSAINFKD